MHGTNRGKNEGKEIEACLTVCGDGVEVDKMETAEPVVIVPMLLGSAIQDNIICWRASGAQDPASAVWA